VQQPSPVRRIVYLVPELGSVSVRHRVDVFVPALQQRGWTVERVAIPRGLVARLRLFRSLRSAGVVVLVRKLFRPMQLRLLRRSSRRLIFDFDDAVLYRDSNREQRMSRLRERMFRETVSACDRVLAGNGYLAKLAGEFGGTASVVPTCIDDERITPRLDAGPVVGRVVIGWIGSRSTLVYLETLRPVFKRLASRFPNAVVLKVVADDFPADMGLDVERKRWAEPDEADDLRSFDIGVMPLIDDLWTRGKCGFKLLQYMAAGAASVASPVGVNAEIIRSGDNGFLAGDEDEWLSALSGLIDDADLRRSMGLRGRESLRGRYTVRDWTEQYVSLIEEVARQSPSAGPEPGRPG
jgi:glycosyltransferase involved in cell wall biosynthesis